MMKKKMLLLFSCLLVLGLAAAGCGKAEAPVMGPESADFVLNMTSDLVFDLDTKGETLQSVDRDGTTLEASAYSHSEGKLTLKNAYLKTLSVGAHVFTCRTAGGSCTAEVTVKAGAPSATPQRVRYDYSNPGDVVFTVDLGGGSIESIRFGETELTASDYVLTGASLSVKQDFIDVNLLENTENTLVLTSEGGSVSLVIETFDSKPVFDKTVFKFQQSQGADVSFSLNPGLETTSVVSVTCGGAALENTDYGYAEETLVVKGSYLAERPAGIHVFEVMLDDAAESKFEFRIGAYGSSEGSHLIEGADTGSLNDFESYEAGASVTLPNTILNIPPVVAAEGIDGKSLQFTIGSEDIHCIFSSNGRPFARDKVHCIKLKLRLDPMSKVIFNWGAGNDFFEINADGTVKYSMDSRSRIVRGEGGVFDLELYSVNKSGSGKLEIYVGTTSAKTTVLLDDLMILETGLPALPPAAPDLGTGIYAGGDVVFTEVAVPSGAVFAGVDNGDTPLRDGSDFVFDGTAGTLTLKDSYLSGQTFPLTLAFKIAAPGDYLGGTSLFSSSFTIDESRTLTASRSMADYDSARFADLAVDTASAFPGVTFSGVTSVKNGSADVPFVYDGTSKIITVSEEYLAGLARGAHTLEILPKDGEERSFYLFKDVAGGRVFDYDFENPEEKPPFTDPLNNGTASIQSGQYQVRPVEAGVYFSTLGAHTLDPEKVYQLKLRVRADASRALSLSFKDVNNAGGMDVLQINFGGAGNVSVPDNGGKVQGFVNGFADNVFDVTIFVKGTSYGKFEIWFQDKGAEECVHLFEEISLCEADYAF